MTITIDVMRAKTLSKFLWTFIMNNNGVQVYLKEVLTVCINVGIVEESTLVVVDEEEYD